MHGINVQQILDELKQAFEGYEISVVSTRQRGGKCLFVVSGFSAAGEIDAWPIEEVRPLYREMQAFLKQRMDVLKYARLLFVRGTQFVFYSPDIGGGSVFRKMETLHNLECYGYEHSQYYVGACLNIDDVVEYLTTTDVWF